MLKICHININSFHNATNQNDLMSFLFEEKIDIVCLAETWSNKKKKCKVPGYNSIEDIRADGYGGAAILLNKNIKYKRIEFNGEGENVIIQTLNLQKNLTIASTYLNPQLRTESFEKHVRKLFMVMQKEKNSIICGDFNAKHLTWGNRINDRKGTSLNGIINASGFNILNNGDPTFHRCLPDISRHSSAIDIACTNMSTINMTWKTHPQLQIGGSHHLACCIEFSSRRDESYKNVRVFNKSKMIKDLEKMSVGDNSKSIQQLLEEQVTINTEKQPHQQLIPKNWWNDNLKTLHNEKKSALQNYYDDPSMSNLEAYKEIRSNFNAQVKIAKQKSWNMFLEDRNEDGAIKIYGNFVKGVRCPKDDTSSRKWDSTINRSYLQHISRNCNATESPCITLSKFTAPVQPISMAELNEFLSKKSPHSAPGIDGISYGIIKSLNKDNMEKVFTAINTSFKNCEVLDSWRKIKICPIPKKDKDLTIHTNFRPIALISVLVKIINGIVKNRLGQWAEK